MEAGEGPLAQAGEDPPAEAGEDPQPLPNLRVCPKGTAKM